MKQSTIFNSDIQYIILIDEYKNQLPFLPPDNVSTTSLDLIRFLPKNFYQFFDAQTYLELICNTNFNFPYKVSFIRKKDENYIFRFLEETSSFKVIFFDSIMDQIIYKKIIDNKKIDNRRLYFFDQRGMLRSVANFNNYILKNRMTILKMLNIKIDINKIHINNEFNEEFDYFIPNKNNFLTYKNHVGEFLFTPLENDEEKTKDKSLSAVKNRSSTIRLDSQLDLINKIDNLFKQHKSIPDKLPYNFDCNPLILSSPFNNPDILEFFNNPTDDFKKKLSTIRLEQNKNFVTSVEVKDGEDERQVGYHYSQGQFFLKEKLSYLDSISFLTSSFKFSPYLRFPVLGKSIYKELSFLSPKNFNKFLTQKAQCKLSDTILKIGKIISEKIMSPIIERHLKSRNSQIISISDLPIEWTSISSVPLSFTHDVTRLPETTYHQLLHSFIFNQNFDFTIDENIINETLVIIGNDEKDFNKWQPMLEDLSKKRGFIFKQCLTVQDFKNTILEIKPKFLIIDTHGEYDDKTKETYLWIGKEKLTNQFIVDNKISIPLVFISACGTAPVYGTHAPIANSFLYAGAKSVTSTFLPIDIDSSTMIYMTILNNLQSIAKKQSFNNWLEYICFNIRSSFIHRTFTILNDETSSQYEEQYHTLAQNILYFKNRRAIYKSVLEAQLKISAKNLKSTKATSYEFLYYTNIGRGDLVLFG